MVSGTRGHLNYVVANLSELGNYLIADNQRNGTSDQAIAPHRPAITPQVRGVHLPWTRATGRAQRFQSIRFWLISP